MSVELRQLPEIVASALDGAAEHRFRWKGRPNASLAGGAELALFQAIFSRIARWIAETGAQPALVVASHTALAKLAPDLLDAETAAQVKNTRRISDFAGAWCKAFDRGVTFPGATENGAPEYEVRFYVRNANAMTTFWFNVEHVGVNGAPRRVVTTARDCRVGLEVVVSETAVEPPFETWMRRTREAALRGSARAKRALQLAARGVGWLLVIAAISYSVFLLLPTPAQASVRRAIGAAWRSLREAIGVPAQSSIDVIAPRDTSPATPPRIVNETNLGPFIISQPNPIPETQISDATAGLEAVSLVGEEPEHVMLLAYPSPQLRTADGSIEFDLGDGSPRVEKPISAANGWIANHSHYFPRRRPEDLGVGGDMAGPYNVSARVYHGTGRQRQVVEVIERIFYIHLPVSIPAQATTMRQ